MSNEVRLVAVTPEDDGQRLDRWLKKHAPNLPYSLVQKLIRKGAIRVDDKRVQMDARLEAGQEVRLPPVVEDGKVDRHFRSKPDDDKFIKSLVIYDDGDMIAINKPSGLATQGGMNIERHVDGLLEHLGDGDSKPKLCHRLDRDTSGILILARTREMAAKIGKAFESKNIRKYYWAIVVPAPEMNDGTIDAPLIKGEGYEKDMMVVDTENGKFSRTEFHVVERAAKKAAFITFWPRTGRTHQLRVHAQAAGFPIIGDEKYGNIEQSRAMIDALDLSPRLHLHAARIMFPHPVTKQMLDIQAPLPPDLRKSWARFGFTPEVDGDPFKAVKV
ncbi:MAG: pseudouridine synthase, RluA family protein [Micavibrio sp.]|nr:pseudouridine synthase, RluA family protein [Micavibrio sp.]